MSEVSPTGLTVIDEVKGGGHTLIFSSRLVMASNTTLQLSLLFAFLYLRANNFGGACGIRAASARRPRHSRSSRWPSR